MKRRSNNPIAANPRAALGALYRALREVPRRGVRTADMVKAEIAATAREFSKTILAERSSARRGNDLYTEELG
jgi:hypothetical protein